MNRAEMTERAAPPCGECGSPVLRVEMPWCRVDGRWVPGAWCMVCAEGHRTAVNP